MVWQAEETMSVVRVKVALSLVVGEGEGGGEYCTPMS